MISFDELCAALEHHQARQQAAASHVEIAASDAAPAEAQAVRDPDVARAESYAHSDDGLHDDGLHEIELPDVLSDDEDEGR